MELYNNYYLKGISSCKLAEMFGHTHKYYLNAFKKEELEIRTNKINSRKYNVNHDYFKEINTHEKAYWLGFIYADGYITNRQNSKKFGMALSIKDFNQLEKLNKCIDSTYPIHSYLSSSGYKTNTEYCRVLITSDSIFDDLQRHGVFENKTNLLEKPNIDCEFYNSFILGYFDGDGSIFLNHAKYPFYTINICGTDNILTFISSYLKSKKIIKKEAKLSKRKEGQIVSYIRYGGNVLVSKILDDLYKDLDVDIPLERKRALYLKCKNRIFN